MTEKMSVDNASNHLMDHGASPSSAFVEYKKQQSAQMFNEFMTMDMPALQIKKEELEVELSLYESSDNKEMLEVIQGVMQVKQELIAEAQRNQEARRQALEKARQNLAILEKSSTVESVAQPTPEATADSLPVVSMPEAITPQLGYIDDVVEIGDSIFNVSHMDQSARLAFVASRSGEVPGTVSDDEGYVEVTKQTAETGEVLQLEELDNELPDESMHKPIDQTSVFSGVELTPTLTPKKSKKHTIPWRSTAVAASAVSRVMPKTRKMRTVAAVAAATLTVGGGVTWAATNDARESLIAECVDESYAGDTIASTTLDAQSSIEWSLMNRDDSPVMRVGEDGKQLPKLTVEGVSVDLEICAVDGKSVSESDGTVSTDASNLVARAVINSNEAASNWQSIDRSLLENAAKSEILSSREAAGYISSMGDKNNVTKATGVTTNELAIQIESDKVMLDKDTSVNAVLIDLAVKGLKQRVAQGERELLINGDVDGVALDFTNATEDQGTQINFDETGTKIDISKSKVTKLHLEDVEEKKEK